MERVTKKAYVRPLIEDFGTVTDLTAVGNTNPAFDQKGGSVYPKGHGY
jgi:hypothetical protein